MPFKPTNNVCDKKFGIFQSELQIFNEVFTELGLIINKTKVRHPLAYLVEAADDICYTIIDFEDGINLGLIEEEFALEYLINLVRDSINTSKYNSLTNKQDRVSYLRALAINTLINEVVDIFITNEEEILQGNFTSALLDKSKFSAQINDIIKLSVSNIYQSRDVVEKEIAGYNIINKLLDIFITSLNNNENGNSSSYDKLILELLPKKFNLSGSNLYNRLLGVCHYISSMSDTQAVITYKKISGNHF